MTTEQTGGFSILIRHSNSNKGLISNGILKFFRDTLYIPPHSKFVYPITHQSKRPEKGAGRGGERVGR
jgi:hypothetical protein